MVRPWRGRPGGYLSRSQRLAVRITAPADAITSYATVTWSEIGKPGN